MVLYALEQHVFLYDIYMKLGSAWKYQWKFLRKFPSRQTIHNLVNILRSMGPLIYKKQKLPCQVLTEENIDVGARLEHTPRKSLKHLAEETGVSTSSARRAIQWLKLRHYKTTVIHTLQMHDPASRIHFFQLVSTVSCCRWDQCAVDILFWWSVVSLAWICTYEK
jgi:hypothetical protein